MSEEPVLEQAALERLRRIGGPRLLQQMIELYLTNGAERVAMMSEGAGSGDLESVERAAHTLKSSAGNVGATRVRRSAEAVERTVVDGRVDDDMVRQLIIDYEESVAALKIALESES